MTTITGTDPYWNPTPVSLEEAWTKFWTESEFDGGVFTFDEFESAKTERDFAVIGRKMIAAWKYEKGCR